MISILTDEALKVSNEKTRPVIIPACVLIPVFQKKMSQGDTETLYSFPAKQSKIWCITQSSAAFVTTKWLEH